MNRQEEMARLFVEALARPPEDRAMFLERATADRALRQEVASLLAAHDQEDALLRAAPEMAGGASNESSGPTAWDPGGLPAAPVGLRTGDRLGRYEILARMGAGGMGEVFRALDTRLRREVAIKVIGRKLQNQSESLKRFEVEARASSALNHPNIVTVYDVGEEGEFPFIVMELVEGQSLRELLTGPLAIEPMLRLAVQIADGLAAAHERQIVHRDLKPENVLVSRQGIAKILDFGIARFRPDEAPAAASSDTSSFALTARGMVLGTAGYMPPELLSGGAADFRSDQFSLGAVLYEMATCTRAFSGTTSVETALMTLQKEPTPVARLRPELPPEVSEIISRCLRKRPEERFASTRELFEELRRIRRAVAARPAQPPSRPSLPTSRTPLVGRRRELDEIKTLIINQDVRLLTLTGPGGTGKTRLALQAARELSSHFTGGVFFVALGPITDAELMLPTLAQTIGAEIETGRSTQATVITYLRGLGGPPLLILDNFEHVMASAPLVSDILAACPEVNIIATSREILHLYGEHDFPVAPLERPDPRNLPPFDELSRAPAVALFVERARAANPSFALTEENSPAVAELCARLDGLPLALELAAAHVRMLPPQALLSRMGQRLKLLTGGARDLPSRQQTLRRTLDWSHELLDENERTLFRRLAVFAGGFTLEAAQAVADPYEQLQVDVVSLLGSLVDKSLLQPTTAREGESRFHMLETIRDYAAERLAEDPSAEETRKAHAAYFLVLAEEGAGAQDQAEITRRLERLEIEHDNFRAALDWLASRGQADWGLRMADGLFSFWERGEYLAEGRRWLETLLSLEQAQGRTPRRARGAFSAGVLAAAKGDRSTSSLRLFEEALEIHGEIGDRWGMAVDSNALGIQHIERKEYDTARARFEQSLALWRELGDEAEYARSLSNLASVAREQGRFAEAHSLFEEAAAIFERLGDRTSLAWAWVHHGDVARAEGSLADASERYCRALAVFRELGNDWGIASTLADLGSAARKKGERSEASSLYRQALKNFAALGHRRGIARLLEALACLAADEGRAQDALRLAAAGFVLRETVGVPVSPAEKEELETAVAAMREKLGPQASRLAWQEGTGLSTTQAIDLGAESKS
jgi:predicted ATPase/tRNA A-37 threonylcarbamoyl transferase component Bud32